MPRTNRVHLTQKKIDALTLQAGNSMGITWHDDPVGLGVRVYDNGRKSYVLRYRIGTGTGATEKLRVLEDVGNVSFAEACAWARKLILDARQGVDPLSLVTYADGEPTVEDLWDVYLTEHVQTLAPASQRTYDVHWRMHILPALGNLYVRDVNQQHVQALKKSYLKKGLKSWNAVRMTLRNAFEIAIDKGWRPLPVTPVPAWRPNPVDGVRTVPAQASIGRRLTKEEMGTLVTELRALDDRGLTAEADALRLCLYTGRRPVDVVTARFDHFDLEARLWSIPRHKTMRKTGRPLVIPLSDAVVDLIEQRRKANRFRAEVFPDVSYNKLNHRWRPIQAKLNGARLYDLRHNFISQAAMTGVSVTTLRALSGHQDLKSLQRYVDLATDHLVDAAAQTAARLHDQMSG